MSDEAKFRTQPFTKKNNLSKQCSEITVGDVGARVVLPEIKWSKVVLQTKCGHDLPRCHSC